MVTKGASLGPVTMTTTWCSSPSIPGNKRWRPCVMKSNYDYKPGLTLHGIYETYSNTRLIHKNPFATYFTDIMYGEIKFKLPFYNSKAIYKL